MHLNLHSETFSKYYIGSTDDDAKDQAKKVKGGMLNYEVNQYEHRIIV